MKILVHGHLGMGNLGDEAMLLPVLDLLRERFPAAQLTVAAGPQAQREHLESKGIRIVARSKMSLLWEILRCHLFVIAGGSHLTSFKNDKRYTQGIKHQLALVTFARLTLSRVFMFSVGFGPFEEATGERLAKRIMRLTHFASVRDAVSVRWLESIQYPSNRFTRCQDAAMFLTPANGTPSGPSLGISLMPFYANYSGNEEKDRELIAALVPIIQDWRSVHPDGQVHLCSFLKQDSPYSDNQVLQPIIDEFQGAQWITLHDETPDVAAMSQRFATFTHFISMRYHSQVFAWLHEVPQLCIIYHRKNAAFAEEYGIPSQACFTMDAILADEMQSAAEKFFREPAQFAASTTPAKLHNERDKVVPVCVTKL